MGHHLLHDTETEQPNHRSGSNRADCQGWPEMQSNLSIARDGRANVCGVDLHYTYDARHGEGNVTLRGSE
jgi:hypothetical protein